MEETEEKLSFSIDWQPVGQGSPEIATTSALIKIAVGDNIATSIINGWSQTTSDYAPVSAYPLALWLASSWWRIRWEPAPFESLLPTSWRLAHEMPSANHGYLWPNLKFESDGAFVAVSCSGTSASNREIIKYLSDFSAHVPVCYFEQSVDEFVSMVLSRLSANSINDSDLHKIWDCLIAERQNPTETKWRKFEAMAGFDPDDLDCSSIAFVENMERTQGREAAAEIGACCRGEAPEKIAAPILNQARNARIDARIPSIPLSNKLKRSDVFPWKQGRELASFTRRSLGFDSSSPISEGKLSDALGISRSAFSRSRAGGEEPLVGVARRKRSGDGYQISYRKDNSTGRRFESARVLCDSLLMPESEQILLTTDNKTRRQKIQRSFAAEFLCPIDSLRDFLGVRRSEVAIERAAQHFEISPLAVASHLANHQEIPAGRLLEYM